MRRQNSSCDQCRKGKRACDAGAVKDLQRRLDADLEWEVDWQDISGPCSNCLKTRKNCTFDWVRSQQLQIRERRQSSTSEKTSASSRKRVKSTHGTTPGGLQGIGENIQDGYQPWNPNAINLFDTGLPTFPLLSEPEFRSSTAESFTLSPTNDTVSNDSPADDLSLTFPSSTSMSQLSCISDELPGLDDVEVFSHDPSIAADFSAEAAGKASTKTRKRSWNARAGYGFRPPAVSEFSPTQAMITRTNTVLMTDNLMKLYHDVMEGALSCWLTEQNCPYLSPQKSSEQLTVRADQPSSNFPNRIYRRVIKLDRSLSSLGIKPLSAAEERKATKALHFSIMAFTAQWAQGSARSQARYRPSSTPEEILSSGIGQEFDATLQLSFWNQARRLLDDCAEINCFKVAFAEIVFGLTQKYSSESEDYDEAGFYGRHDVNTTERIQEAFDRDGYNVFMERAARRLHVLKRRVENFDRRTIPGSQKGSFPQKNCNTGENSEERKTMELIFWLAIMFDTISAAITEKPVAVSDEESKESVEKQPADDVHHATQPQSNERWNDRAIIKRHQKLAPLRWPCPEEAVSRELRDAAPVKVLLFRKITRIQTLSSRGAGQQAVEDAIQDASSVYRHWNMTYGPLFQDCIQYHNSLPSKVQSWYVCLLGHWLLAVMILADALSTMDAQGLSMPSRASERAESGLIDRLRKTSARMVSDLARASTPRDDDLGKLQEFHHAVHEGALLTEPWTMVLIRSFTMAGTLLLDEGAKSEQEVLSANNTSKAELFGRCEDCVKALWYLGRKSTLSRQVAGILGDGVQKERLKAFEMERRVSEGQGSTMFGQVEVF